MTYFSDKERGAAARTKEDIPPAAWGGIAAAVQTAVADGSLGLGFPDTCSDGGGPVGTDFHLMYPALTAEVPGISWPLSGNDPPSVLSILDLIEFTHKHIGKPIRGSYHPFFQHYHLSYDHEVGQTGFRERINLIFARNGIAFELHGTGEIRRLGPPAIREALQSAGFTTGNSELDAMLETARIKFLDPNPAVRREALEKLWDAWERLKTILPGLDKKTGIKTLLDTASPEPNLRSVLEEEAAKLTSIGNSFQIRHSETTQTPLQQDAQVDYLFHRLFALIWLILRPPPTPTAS